MFEAEKEVRSLSSFVRISVFFVCCVFVSVFCVLIT